MPVATRLPHHFVVSRQRTRILDALAELSVTRGYRATRIEDICRVGAMARKTFYENYGSKEEAAIALVAATAPDLAAPDLESGIGISTLELAAQGHRDPGCALSLVRPQLQVLEHAATRTQEIAITVPGDPFACTLPPGRHGLDEDFVTANQRKRIMIGLAESLAENGYCHTTLVHVATAAAISRRTFYEHFDSMEAAATGLAEVANPSLPPLNLRFGWNIAAIEIVAAGAVGKDTSPMLEEAAEILGALEAALQTSGQVAA